jgi:hypothetical protein
MLCNKYIVLNHLYLVYYTGAQALKISESRSWNDDDDDDDDDDEEYQVTTAMSDNKRSGAEEQVSLGTQLTQHGSITPSINELQNRTLAAGPLKVSVGPHSCAQDNNSIH